jgi:hypothetical protein
MTTSGGDSISAFCVNFRAGREIVVLKAKVFEGEGVPAVARLREEAINGTKAILDVKP